MPITAPGAVIESCRSILCGRSRKRRTLVHVEHGKRLRSISTSFSTLFVLNARVDICGVTGNNPSAQLTVRFPSTVAADRPTPLRLASLRSESASLVPKRCAGSTLTQSQLPRRRSIEVAKLARERLDADRSALSKLAPASDVWLREASLRFARSTQAPSSFAPSRHARRAVAKSSRWAPGRSARSR